MKNLRNTLVSLFVWPTVLGVGASADQSIPTQVGASPILMSPHGATPDAGWALSRLNDADPASATPGYLYPDTLNSVRLYLIDTAIDTTQGIFDDNENATVSSSTPIPATAASSSFTHATQMLSIIAASGTGAAIGTPIEVVSYDVYSANNGQSTTVGLVAAAVTEARFHHLLNPDMPAVICIASGSDDMADSALLEAAITGATSDGITVVVSAGNNQGANASNYIPSAYGSENGVICVGASNIDNGVDASSNIGPSVDLYAPGQNVACLNPDGSAGVMNGTSPAAALAAAAALVQLSINPELTPAEVETTLKANAFASTVPLLQIGTDSDKDGMDDQLERFFGSDPLDPANRAEGLSVSRSGGVTSISFGIAEDQFDSTKPYELLDGDAWQIWRTVDLSGWSSLSTEVGLMVGLPDEGIVPVTYLIAEPSVRSVYQLELSIGGETWMARNIVPSGLNVATPPTPEELAGMNLAAGIPAQSFYVLVPDPENPGQYIFQVVQREDATSD